VIRINLLAAASLGGIWGKAWPILVAILYFGFLIFSHELGHFSVARAFRVNVMEFSMGMGPRLLKHKSKKTGILYSLKAVPFGGSVLLGEDEQSEEPRAFVNQKPWKRFCILVAGALVNLACGVLIMGAVVASSPTIVTTQVRGFAENAVTMEQGLRSGDVIRKVGSRRVRTWMDLQFLLSRGGTKFDIEVLRDGKRVKLPGLQFPVAESPDGAKELDYDFGLVYYSRDPEAKYASGRPTAGLMLRETFRESLTVGRMVWLSLLDMVTGKFRLSDLSGPIGVVTIITNQAQAAQDSAQAGNRTDLLYALLNLMLMLSMISINIGMMNLLPIPALDGGRLLFCLAEGIFRKPVPKKLESYVHAAGFALLMIFMVVISFSDIWALVTGKR